MFKVRYDPITELQAVVNKQGVESYVQWNDFLGSCNVVATLPADAPPVSQKLGAPVNNFCLLRQIIFQSALLFVALADIVRGRSHDELGRLGQDFVEEF